MHHGSERLPNDFIERFRQAEAEQSLDSDNTMKFGATGRFPGGKLNETDEGEIQFGVAMDKKNAKVVIDFGKPVAWMATDAEQAISLGNLLVRHGKRLLREKRSL